MISIEERKGTRKALKRLADLKETIENCARTHNDMPERMGFILRQLTDTDNMEQQHKAVIHLFEDLEGAYREKLRAAAPWSLSCFAEYINPEEPPAPHHEFMCGKLEAIESRDLMRMMLSMPPGHAKSTYCSKLFPAWYMGKNPRHKYIQGGYGQEFVEKNFGMKVKAIVESKEFNEVFPGLTVNNDLKANGYWGLVATDGPLKGRQLGEYVTRGVGQGIAGFRANCAGVDDPYATRKEAESPARRKEVYDWFQSDFTPRLLPKSPMFIVATRWNTQDLCATIEEWNKEGKGIPWDVINLAAISEEEDDAMGRAPGDPLWPDFYTKEHLENLKSTLEARDWNSLYMGKPIDEEGGTLTSSMLHHYDRLPEKDSIRRVIVSVDCANKNNQRADYTAVTVWLETLDRKYYLKHVVRVRVEFAGLIKVIEDTAREHQASVILVEDKGAGTQYIQTRQALAPAPVIGIEPGQNGKEFRFDGVTPMFEAGTVLLPKSGLWVPDYIRELLTFPESRYDDQVDSTSQALSWARRGRAGGTKKLGGTGLGSDHESRLVELSRLAGTATENRIG